MSNSEPSCLTPLFRTQRCGELRKLGEGLECDRGIEGKESNCEPKTETDMFVQVRRCVSFIVMSHVNVWCNTTYSVLWTMRTLERITENV